MKLFKKIAIISVGAMMAIGVGVSTAAQQPLVGANADSITETTAQLATANSWVDGTKYTSFALDSNITISCTGGSNTGKYYSSNSSWRLYQTETGTIIITAAVGYDLTSVCLIYSVSKTGTLPGLTSNTTVAVSGSSVSYTVGNTGAATNGNVQITSFTVEYAASSATSVSVGSTPSGNIAIGDTGTLTAISANATSPTYSWSSSASSVIEINALTGAYEAKAGGSAEITVTMTCNEGTFIANATITVNYGLITIAEANTLCSSLASGTTSSYKVTVEGTITVTATSSVTISDGTNSLLIYGTYSPNNAANKGWIINGTISFVGNLQNYNGTYEIVSPTVVSYTDDAIAFATASNSLLDSECEVLNVTSETWATLASNYGLLDTYAKARLTAATSSDANSAEIADFTARYINIVNKYGYTNFMERALSANPNQVQSSFNNVYLVIIVAFSSFAVLGVALLLKKKKEVK